MNNDYRHTSSRSLCEKMAKNLSLLIQLCAHLVGKINI